MNGLIGIIILLVLGVIFYFIIKPKLEGKMKEMNQEIQKRKIQ